MNIMIAGVGGQGTLLLSKILGSYAAYLGYDCKVSEVHGMAQRGGSVVTYVKFGEKVYSPVICEGEADALIALEALEALRMSHFVKTTGKIIYSTQQIMPMPVITGAVEYPKDIKERLGDRSVGMDAMAVAKSLGNERAANVVLFGLAAKKLNLDKAACLAALNSCLKESIREMNIKAFEAGNTYDL